MIRIDVITLFPEYFDVPLQIGPLRKAKELGVLEIHLHNLRDYADSPKEVDDYPFGGGSGMILKPEPIKRAIDVICKEETIVILFTPQGKTYSQQMAKELSKRKHLLLICGRYKDVDDRIRKFVHLELSIGDYVLSGGEPAALVILDSIARLLPNTLGDEDSRKSDSFENWLLDCPYYTRPRVFEGMEVPKVLLSGDHKKIERWRKKESLRRTLLKRPDLLKKANLSEDELELLREVIKEEGMEGGEFYGPP